MAFAQHGIGEVRGQRAATGIRRFPTFEIGVTLCLLAFTACDSEQVVEAVPEPELAVAAAAPQYLLTPVSVNLKIDEYFRFLPVLTDGTGNQVTDATWTTSNSGVLTVNSHGTVRGRGDGTAVLTATSPTHGVSTATVNVGTAAQAVSTNDPALTATTKPELAHIYVHPYNPTIAPGATLLVSAGSRDQYGNRIIGVKYKWWSANPAVAKVSPTGVVTAVSAGTARIRATSGATSGYTHVTVSGTPTVGPPPSPVVTTISVTPATTSVEKGLTRQLTATVKDQSGNTMTGVAVTWASANPAIATVSSNGVVTGIGAGQVAVAASASGKSGSALVTVTAPIVTTPPPTGGSSGIWISQSEIMALPMSGAGWSNVKSAADGSCGTPDLANQDDPANVCVLAKALVYARTGGASYRDGVLAALRSIVGSGTYSGRALALGRELPAYVIAADIINLKTVDPALDTQFRAKINELRTTLTDGGPASIIECNNRRPNNWGTWCGAARVAVALYLGDKADFDRAVLVFRGWAGDRSAYSSFTFGDLWWQADPTRPVGINPKGAGKEGADIDGVLPDDQRRCGTFSDPPCVTDYIWGALEGAIVTANMIHRRGLPAFEWSDRALLRAYRWLYGPGNNPAVGNDTWQPYLVNYMYGAGTLPTGSASPGKNMGWTDWTHRR